MVKNDPLIKPYLKWAGGKRQLLAEIKKNLPKNISNYTYYEPFIGAGA
ncbi:MAG: DNA adenine methylase, partial [Treponema sp.]|nr:DNA adenine methylase [Treponema sp.]